MRNFLDLPQPEEPEASNNEDTSSHDCINYKDFGISIPQHQIVNILSAIQKRIAYSPVVIS
jgi:hypothetical protein